MISFALRTLFSFCIFFSVYTTVHAALTLTSGSNATTTPNVATSITGFQIVGPSASTTPVRLRATYGTLSMTTTTGLTFSGASSGSTVSFSGTVENINNALSTLKYTRASTGTDTLEVSLVESGEVFFSDNGHLYKFISGSINALSARTAAANQTAYGATGYLATITSQEENDFVADRLQGDGWMGASDEGSEGVWKWVTGPEAGTTFWNGASGGSVAPGQYANWSTGEPNDWLNGTPGEDCAQFYISSSQWNDLNCTGNNLSGYVVEFGAPGNLPTVVATNISIVTADVPAVTTLSPANGASSISPSANLVITFSKSVTPQTGTIGIYRASDDSIVASIDVAGGLVTGGGTNTITINPSSDLAEGVQHYVTIPSTAFKDSSDNYFNGISGSTTWSFTTSDVTSPVISSIATSTATTTATITWNTNELASTRLWYSLDTQYASSTAEADLSPRVLSHSVSLSDLVACTQYNFKVVSRDSFSNYATSTADTFITTGCAGGVSPSSVSSQVVAVSGTATSTVTDTDRSLSVVTPANFTSTSSSVVIQIKGMDSDTVLGSIGSPSGSLLSGADIVFNVTALIDNTTELDSFDIPVTVTYTYTDADIEGLDESTLSMYHYKNSAWSELDDCSVNVNSNTITCTAPHFSIFAIFGSRLVVTQSVAASSLPWCSGPQAPGWNASLPNGGCDTPIHMTTVAVLSSTPSISQEEIPSSVTSNKKCSVYVFNRTLRQGSKGEDVRELQKLLNCLGFLLANDGPGAPGSETNLFAERTYNAVVRFQEAYAQDILVPLNLEKGTGIFAQSSRKKAGQL